MIVGSVRRPTTGKVVLYRLTQPIEDLVSQGKKHGFPNLGTIGNADHLQKHGDHTPWAFNKLPGWIYAKDTSMPSEFAPWLVAKCKSTTYDTSWIDYFNIDGRQYNCNGRYLCPSNDTHFHISVKKGFEKKHVTLFDDFANRGDEEMPSADEVAAAVWKHGVESKSFDNGKTHGVHEGVINAIDANRRIRAMEKEVAALRGDVRAILMILQKN